MPQEQRELHVGAISGWTPLALLVLVTIPDDAGAQLDRVADPTHLAVARACAPTLRFAEGEAYFPTSPGLLALETSQGRWVMDLRQARATAERPEGQPPPTLGESVPWAHSYEGLGDYLDSPADFETEDRFYRRAFERLFANVSQGARWGNALAAVLYDVRELNAASITRFLNDLAVDPQAERRYLSGMSGFGQGSYGAVMIDYWLYYVRDTGLEGHPHDIERVTVVTDAYSEVLIGSAHSKNEPNNVAVSPRSSCWRSEQRPAFFVELGGHGSAPDRNRNGRFALGEDLNWHAQDAWGLRDAPALTGQAWAGQYQPFMTLSHDSKLANCFVPAGTKGTSQDCGQSRVVRYSLVPVSALEKMQRAAGSARSADETLLAAADTFASYFGHLMPPSETPSQHRGPLLQGLRRSGRPMPRADDSDSIPVGEFSPWLHEEFADGPSDRLLPFLHRRAWAPGLTLEWYHETSWALGGTLLVPVHEWVPLSLGGFTMVHGQVVRWLRGDEENPAPSYGTSWSIEADYHSAYRGPSWWIGLAYMRGSDPVDGTDRSPLSVRVGVSVPLCLPTWTCYEGILPFRLSPHVRLDFVGSAELGVRLDVW